MGMRMKISKLLHGFIEKIKRLLWGEYVECEFCHKKIPKKKATMLLPSCDYCDSVNFLCEKYGGDCIFWGNLWACPKCSESLDSPYIYVGDACADIIDDLEEYDELEEEEYW